MTAEGELSARGWRRAAAEMTPDTLTPGAWRYTIVKPTIVLSAVIIPRKLVELKLTRREVRDFFDHGFPGSDVARVIAADIHHENERGEPCDFLGRCELRSCSPIVDLLWFNTGNPDRLEQSEHFWSGFEGIGDGYLLGFEARQNEEADGEQENAR